MTWKTFKGTPGEFIIVVESKITACEKYVVVGVKALEDKLEWLKRGYRDTPDIKIRVIVECEVLENYP